MKLGLSKDEVRLVPYTNQWEKLFNEVKRDILHHTSLSPNAIVHVGSTAIDGMMAKPIIDIAVGVEDISKLDKPFFKDLQRADFLRLRVERPEEVVLARFRDDTYQVKTHYIHLVNIEGSLWKNLIFFRDYLNKNEAVKREYLQIKQAYLRYSSTNINAYTEHKETFVKRIYQLRDQI